MLTADDDDETGLAEHFTRASRGASRRADSREARVRGAPRLVSPGHEDFRAAVESYGRRARAARYLRTR